MTKYTTFYFPNEPTVEDVIDTVNNIIVDAEKLSSEKFFEKHVVTYNAAMMLIAEDLYNGKYKEKYGSYFVPYRAFVRKMYEEKMDGETIVNNANELIDVLKEL